MLSPKALLSYISLPHLDQLILNRYGNSVSDWTLTLAQITSKIIIGGPSNINSVLKGSKKPRWKPSCLAIQTTGYIRDQQADGAPLCGEWVVVAWLVEHEMIVLEIVGSNPGWLPSVFLDCFSSMLILKWCALKCFSVKFLVQNLRKKWKFLNSNMILDRAWCDLYKWWIFPFPHAELII